MLDETFIALALGLALFTALVADPELIRDASTPTIVSIADLPAAGATAAAPDDLHLPVWVAAP